MKIGYKATYDMKCHDLTYEVGATYKCNKLKIGEYGFHYCKNLDDCLLYYKYKPSLKILKIQDLSENTIREGYKFCSDHIKVLEVVDNPRFKNIELDELGRVIKKKYSNGFWETYKYDERGNKVKHEDSDGYWETHEYDDRGNIIRYEDSDGFWRTFEYDDRGNKIRFKNSYGFWESWEYDDRGNLVKYENSNGQRETYEYDEKDNLIGKNDYKIEIIRG